MPELYCPFPSAINVYADAVHEDAAEWAQRFGLLSGESARKLFAGAGIGRFAALCHPDAPLDELRLMSHGYAWFFLQDDMEDESEVGRRPGELSEVDNRLLDILEGDAPDHRDERLTHAFYDLRGRLEERLRAQALATTWMRRFVRSVREHLDSTLWEAANRARGTVPDLESYIRMRPLTGGMVVATELTGIVEGTYLSQDVRGHPTVARITEASYNAVCWANDILSLDKELEYADVNNLVIVLRHAYEFTWQEATDRAAEMHDAEVGVFVELEANLPSFGTLADEYLQRYVANLRARIRGVLDWSYETERYRTAAGGVAATSE